MAFDSGRGGLQLTAADHAPRGDDAALESLADQAFAFVTELTPAGDLREALQAFAAGACGFDSFRRAQCKRLALERLRAAGIRGCGELIKLAFLERTAQRRSARDAGWESALTRTASGGYAPTTGNVLNVLRYDDPWDAALGRNDRSGQTLWIGPPPWRASERAEWQPIEVRDSDYARIAEWFEASRFRITVNPACEALHGALEVAAEDRRFDPVVDYLNVVHWDGTPRLDNLLAVYFGAKSDDDTQREYLAAVGARALIAAVARALDPGCKADHVLTLVGAQGIGKSTAIRTLAGEDHFADSLPDLKHKDAADYLRGPWIVELSELDSLSRSELATAKAFLTRTSDRFRAAYGRRTETHARRCVFVGSTNEDAFLADATGNRRFWPVTVGRIQLEALRRDRDQFWGEAVARYRAGEPWHLDSKRLAAAAIDAQAERQIVDVWQPYVGSFVVGRERVSVQEVLRALGLNIEHCGQAEQNRVARCLRQLDWRRHQIREGGRRVWLYLAPTGPR